MSELVLVTAPYFLPVADRFVEEFKNHDVELRRANVLERLEEDELLSVINGVDDVISGDDRFTRRVLETADRLKVISKWGTGIDSIDSVAAAELGISVYRTPNAFTGPVSDTVLGYILCFARNLPFMDAQMKNGVWEKIPGRALSETIIGVIGVGDIGRAVLRRAKPFGARLLGCDISPPDNETANQLGVEMVSVDELLGTSDYISLNCDLNPTSYHLINAETLTVMKSSAVIINTARGPIVDEQALIEALRAGRIAGAALDVFEHEPLPSSSPLRNMNNVLIAPHNCNSSPTAWESIHLNTVANVLRGLGKIS